MTVAAVSEEGKYMYTYHAPVFTSIRLDSATSIGEYAFAYCLKMTDVSLNDNITEIPAYAFAGCFALENIDLSKVKTIGDNAFIEDAQLKTLNLSSVESIGEYAFVYCSGLQKVTLSEVGTDIGEGAFSYCEKLSTVENLQHAKNIDSYAFAYTAIVEADLSGAISLGDTVFLKDKLTPFTVKLGSNLTSVGNNPFAMCQIKPFSIETVITFNGVDYPSVSYTFDLNDSVRVVDGALYAKAPNGGYELIVYTGLNVDNIHIAENTIRIGAFAFAGTDVKMVTMPYTVAAVGHKAFFGCNDLRTVIFTSYDAPIIEEEFDSVYYETFEHIPGTGDFGNYNDYEGNEISITGMGLLPYYMWNATGGMYSNVFYGANFVDYVGYVDNKLTMVRPSNGQHYDTFVLDQYFDIVIDGAPGADDITLAAIDAINRIPERVTYEDRDIVYAARAAYDKIATKIQQSLVTNYDVLVTAEQRIKALTPTDGSEGSSGDESGENSPKANMAWIAWIVLVVGIGGVAAAVLFELSREGKLQLPKVPKKKKPAAPQVQNEAAPMEQEEEKVEVTSTEE